MDSIPLRGVRVHNLKNIDFDIPLRRLTVITGVSGAGKSSLAFDTLYAEAQRRFLQSFSAYTRQFLERFDQPEADFIGDLPPAIAVRPRLGASQPRATVGTLSEVVDFLRLLFARIGQVRCLKCRQVVRAQYPRDVLEYIQSQPAGSRFTIAFPSVPEGDVAAWAADLQEQGFVRLRIDAQDFRLDRNATLPTFSEALVLIDRVQVGHTTPERLTDSIETAFAKGQGRLALVSDSDTLHFDQRLICLRCRILYPKPEPRLFNFNDPMGACPTCQGTGLVQKSKETCPTCGGSRLNEQAGAVVIADQNLAELSARPLANLATFCESLDASDRVVAALKEQLRKRLDLLSAVELGHLRLDRSANDLASGETRRLRLAGALASNLVGALYILDEPTAGLAVSERPKLFNLLAGLRDAGNTVVVVEHDRDFILGADHVIDVGPGAGAEGGTVLFQGPPRELLQCQQSVTAQYLSDAELPQSRGRKPKRFLRLGDTELPLEVLCLIAGPNAESFLQRTLHPALTDATGPKIQGRSFVQEVELMDQEPLGRSNRSNPATVLKIFDEIRKVFADTTEAKIRNFGPGHFSFNQPGGRCDACQGQGQLDVDLQFLPDVAMTCPECQGKRFQPGILQVKVRSLDIAEVLDLTAREAFRFFRAHGLIERRLKPLLDVGLDYLRLGQPLETLSGGESQRLKLAGHLATTRKAGTLFLLVEPTLGLHPADVEVLLTCFDRLVDAGHSVMVADHHPMLAAAADGIVSVDGG